MVKDIKTVTVLGAGSMGGTIAAQLANAGIKVHLLDLKTEAVDNRVIEMKKANLAADPLNAGFMHPSNAKLITPGNFTDDLETAVEDSDWVIEVVVENLGIKQGLFERIENAMKPGTIVTSNTSTIPLASLEEGRSDAFRKNFAITHFFNPPRIMRLLEIVRGADTSDDTAQTLAEICDTKLGKDVRFCNDTPGMMANRIGVYFMFRTIAEALKRDLPIEDADAIFGKPMGFPKNGVFGLLDMVGIGLIPHLTESLQNGLAKDDAFHAIDGLDGLKVIEDMIKDGRTGRRSGKGGFYRMQKNADGSKVMEAIDLKTGAYRPKMNNRLAAAKAGRKGLRAVFEAKSPHDDSADIAWTVMRDVLLYAASLVPSVTNNIDDIDASMRQGYNWAKGPFEMLDEIGHDYFIERVKEDGLKVPPVLTLAGNEPFYKLADNGQRQHMSFDFTAGTTSYEADHRPAGVIRLDDAKKAGKPILETGSASLWDIGDGVACFEVHTKSNALDPSVMLALNESIKTISNSEGRYKAMVIYNDGNNFSLGANLGLIDAGFKLLENKFLKATGLNKPLEKGLYKVVENMIYQGQAVYKAMREAPFPVIGAPAGMALGGGCEMLLHCDGVQAHAETYTGLVELGVGFIPAWGGTTRRLERSLQAQKAGLLKGGPFPPVKATFEALAAPHLSTSSSAQDAKRKLWLGPKDGISMNRDRLLADAKNKALAMVPGYEPPKPATFNLSGKSAASAFKSAVDDFYLKGMTTHHDVRVLDALGNIVSGGDTHIGITLTEEDLEQLERENFMSLLRTQGTKDRVSYMMKTGKPLREGAPQGNPTMAEIRAVRENLTLPRRPLTGTPLTGNAEKTLRRMASLAELALDADAGKLKGSKGKWQAMRKVANIIAPGLS